MEIPGTTDRNGGWQPTKELPTAYKVQLNLPVFLLMTVLTQSFLAFVCCNFVTLTLFTTRHVSIS